MSATRPPGMASSRASCYQPGHCVVGVLLQWLYRCSSPVTVQNLSDLAFRFELGGLGRLLPLRRLRPVLSLVEGPHQPGERLRGGGSVNLSGSARGVPALWSAGCACVGERNWEIAQSMRYCSRRQCRLGVDLVHVRGFRGSLPFLQEEDVMTRLADLASEGGEDISTGSGPRSWLDA